MRKKKATGRLNGLLCLLAAGLFVCAVSRILGGRLLPMENGTRGGEDGPWERDGTAVEIRLMQDGTVIGGRGVEVSGNLVTIKDGGTYLLSGELSEGQICVDAHKEDSVVLQLAGVDIRNGSEAAIHIQKAGRTTLLLADGTHNRLQSGKRREIGPDKTGEDASGGVVYAKGDLWIGGAGELQVFGYVNNGLHCADHLVIEEGDLTIEAMNNGVKGKDSVRICGGELDILSGRDGIKSDDASGEGTGKVLIEGGSLRIRSGDDGIQAETFLQMTGGELEIHADAKGMCAKKGLDILGGRVWIPASEEGLESNRIWIGGGEVDILARDDGINACGGPDSGKQKEGTWPVLRITDGTVRVNADGDGLDSNGDILIEGGTVEIDGPVSDRDGALDFGVENGGSCRISGGRVIAVGSSGMAVTFGEGSAQCSFLHLFSVSLEAGSEITVTDGQGRTLFSHTVAKEAASVVFSSPELSVGETYRLTAADRGVEIVQSRISVISGE